METTPHISLKADSRVVWLDVVRLIAMFTVVCCHCTDPFNFYPGTAPNIEDIKFWGAVYGAVLRPCVPLFVMKKLFRWVSTKHILKKTCVTLRMLR